MTADHSAEFEEVMALVDGELPAAERDRVRAHLASCGDCQQLAGELGMVSERLHEWTVGAAPNTLQLRQGLRWFERRKFLAAAAMLAITVGAAAVLVVRQDRTPAFEVAAEWSDRTLERKAHATPAETAAPQANAVADLPERVAQAPPSARTVAPAGPLVIRTASLSLVVRDHDTGRAELERIARSVNGFIGNLVASGARGAAPTLSATLRVPASRLDETLTALKRLGSVQHERQGSDDVTRQSADLDARLANARASEARLSDILKNRTGRLSDVLDVEREIARVRGEIEQMEAERKGMNDRIAYATLQVELTTERKAEAVTGPMAVSTRLRNAVVDGYAAAVERAIALAVFVAEILPTLLLWLVMIAPPAWFIRRRIVRIGRV
jgi:hypothetical protein